MATISEKMTAIANAIRTKTGGTGALNLDGMANALNNIPERGTNDLTASGATVTVPAGNYKSSTSKSVATATQATPSISIDSAGKITASATQTAGYVTAGTKSGTKQLTVQAAQTITPGTSNKTIASGRYLTGTQTIKGDSNLKAANIKKGVSIFGVAGSVDSLNFNVVGGTSQPSNPTENTIWVNTSTAINNWNISVNQPESAVNGDLWIKTGSISPAPFNAIASSNNIQIYTTTAYQYINGSWQVKDIQIYQGSQWKAFRVYLYSYGNVFKSITGGYYVGAASSNGSVKLNSNNISFSYGSDETSAYAIARTKNSLDLTDYSTINFDMAVSRHYDMYGGGATVGIISNAAGPGNGGQAYVASAKPTVDGTRRIVSIPIKNVNSGYVCMHGIMRATIYEIYLE